MTRIGNAPVSYGAFEVTVGHDENVPGAGDVLDAVREAGYEGIDLGPLGYLGLGDELRAELASRSLLLTGGYVEIDVSDEDTPARGLRELAEVCDQFDAVSEGLETSILPRPTVAIIAPEREPTSEDDEARWSRIERNVAKAVDLCRSRGYEACLHNEVGTQISSEESIDRILAGSEASLCLDTGHLVAAGGDPCAILERWRDRVSHVHLKDARMAGADPYDDAMKLWEGDVFCPLGAGDGQVDEVLDSLRASGYDGWIVVEQDVLPREASAYQRARDDQLDNRRYLRDRGW
jgi:inosose dehydratase